MKILSQVDSVLLSRKVLTIELEHEKRPTPKTEEVKKELSSFLKVPEDLIAIKHIYTFYGRNASKIMVHIYKNKEDLNNIEFKKKKPRKKKEKKQKAQEAPK